MNIFKFIDSNELLLDSFKLGKKIYDSGFIPNHVISLWRGGTPVGLGVGQFFRMQGHLINHTTVATASYTGINKRSSEVIIKGLEHLIKVIAKEDKLLIIDDIYDTGNTINAVIESIKKYARANTPDNILIACVHNKLNHKDFGHNIISIEDVADGVWVSYPHEIEDFVSLDKDDIIDVSTKSESVSEIINSLKPFPVEEIKTDEDYIYYSANEMFEDSMKLAYNIFDSGFVPDFIIAIWPGGIIAGLPIHEYYKYRIKKDHPEIKLPDHISINTTASHFTYKFNIIGIKYLEDKINYNDKILLVDMVYSTGRLTNQIVDKLRENLRRNINIENIKIASVYYYPQNNATSTTIHAFDKPHFYYKKVNKQVIYPQQIHRFKNPKKELEKYNPTLKAIIYD